MDHDNQAKPNAPLDAPETTHDMQFPQKIRAGAHPPFPFAHLVKTCVSAVVTLPHLDGWLAWLAADRV